MDVAHREPESMGYRSRVAHTRVRSMDILGFPLREWRLLTVANRILDKMQCQFGCSRSISYKPSSETGLHLDWVGIASGTLSVFISYFSGIWHSCTDRLPVLVQSLPLWCTGRWWITTCNLFHICKVVHYPVSIVTYIIIQSVISPVWIDLRSSLLRRPAETQKQVLEKGEVGLWSKRHLVLTIPPGGANDLWQGFPENQASKGRVYNYAFTKFRWGLAGLSGRNSIKGGRGKKGKYIFTSWACAA